MHSNPILYKGENAKEYAHIMIQFLFFLQVILCYKVKKCGTDFRWNMFGMTVKDADNLGSGLKVCKKLSK